MSVTTERGPRPVRLAFPEPVSTPDGARKALVAMVGEARAVAST
jgi:putative heme iron utilization protein